MNILWFSWKDRHHPNAGGAELVTSELLDRLVRDGHSVKMITARYKGSHSSEILDNGISTFRTGNRFTVYLKANRLYKASMRDWADIVIDEMNTIPFMPRVSKGKLKVLFNHQLAREVWFYQMPFPISCIGYLLEPLMLRYISNKYDSIITVSKSTQEDLARYGFKDIHIIREGITMKPLSTLTSKKEPPIVLIHGAIRPMKRTLDAVKAFEAALKSMPSLQLVITGDATSKYATETVLPYIKNSRYSEKIQVLGRVSADKRLELMQQASTILVASIKEGWGLIVTEANSQGTPAVVYDVGGLRDSVRDKKTGLLAKAGDPEALGSKIIELLEDKKQYEKLRKAAWEWSKEFTFENSYKDLVKITGIKNHG